jgi:hypothetical protein
MITGTATAIAATLLDALAATGADALNLRIHAPGIDIASIDHQIDAMGDVLAAARAG